MVRPIQSGPVYLFMWARSKHGLMQRSAAHHRICYAGKVSHNMWKYMYGVSLEERTYESRILWEYVTLSCIWWTRAYPIVYIKCAYTSNTRNWVRLLYWFHTLLLFATRGCSSIHPDLFHERLLLSMNSGLIRSLSRIHSQVDICM